ncbi:hypothetical protein Nepgr_023636 [Nepenthes gracilis]|uniref:V-type proton ATPase subunit G n=1 Tax=Nepenthes gracilis TaxID=150966 RepID=A0AAD3XZ89_NEPGR|nr:hypothetical protein Nepgr_023636 [Nepenthes gracilis]
MDSMKRQGIQMLLAAEQEAQRIISDARNLKTQGLRHAKEEAGEEIARYHSHLEEEHQTKLSETSGSSGSNVKRLEEETEMKIQSLKNSASRISFEVAGLLKKHGAGCCQNEVVSVILWLADWKEELPLIVPNVQNELFSS